MSYKTVKLANLPIEWKRGSGLKKSDITKDGKNPCILYGELFTTHKKVAIDKTQLSYTNKSGQVISKQGDVLVPATSTASRKEMILARQVDSDGIILGGDINVVRAKEGVFAKKYLPYFFESLEAYRQLDRHITGSTGIIHISNSGIKNLELPLPEILEQERIVAKIEELFSEIDNTETNLLSSSALLKGYWSAAFEKLYKDEGEAILLSDCIELSQNGLAKRNSKSGIDYKVLRLADIKNKSITQNSARYIKLENKEIEKYKLLPDDLVAIRVNGSRELVGNLIYYPKDEEWAYCDHFIRLRAKEGVLHPMYLKYYFETQFVKNYLKQKMVSTAGQNTISQGSLLSLMIPMVTMEKQTEIVMKAKEIESELLSLNTQIATLLRQCKTNKQTILSKAFKGELI